MMKVKVLYFISAYTSSLFLSAPLLSHFLLLDTPEDLERIGDSILSEKEVSEGGKKVENIMFISISISSYSVSRLQNQTILKFSKGRQE